MNRIDTSNILDPNRLQPLTGPSLDFLQDSYKKAIGNLAYAFMGPYQNNNFPLILWGLYQTGPNISEGAVYDFTTKEIYYIPASSIGGFSNPAVLRIVTTNDIVADPLTFSDGSVFAVHNIREMEIVDSPNTGSTVLWTNVQHPDLTTNTTTLSTGGSWTGSCQVTLNPRTGMVQLQGILSILGSGTIGTLPAIYRPTSNRSFSTNYRDDGQWNTPGMIKVSSAGVISFDANFGGSTFRGVSMDSVNYFR